MYCMPLWAERKFIKCLKYTNTCTYIFSMLRIFESVTLWCQNITMPLTGSTTVGLSAWTRGSHGQGCGVLSLKLILSDISFLFRSNVLFIKRSFRLLTDLFWDTAVFLLSWDATRVCHFVLFSLCMLLLSCGVQPVILSYRLFSRFVFCLMMMLMLCGCLMAVSLHVGRHRVDWLCVSKACAACRVSRESLTTCQFFWKLLAVFCSASWIAS